MQLIQKNILIKQLNTNNLFLTRNNSSLNEKELVALLQSKDKNAFAILYDNYSAALYGVIIKIIRIEEIAQDVLQDSFIKIWKNIESYNAEKGTLFTWILNISRNTALDKLRSKEYKQIIQNKPIETSVIKTDDENAIPIDHIGLRKVVEQLKSEHQEVIEIIYFKGYTHTEAAEVLNLPLGTLKTRVKIALRELRKLTLH